MLRSNGIGSLHSLIHSFCQKDVAELIQGFLNDILSGKFLYKFIHLTADLFCQLSACGDQNGGCQLVMLCLGKKICCHKARVCTVICKNKDLAWACNGINTHMSVNCFFCKSNKNISRPYNLVNLWNTLSSIGKSCHCLSASCLIDFICPGFLCRNKSRRVYLSIRSRRGCHNDSVHTCDFGRNNVHKHGRGINCLSSRHINSHLFKRRYLLSQHGAILRGSKPAVLLLFFVIASDIYQRLPDHIHKIRIHSLIGFPDFFLSDLDILFCDLRPVKFFCVCKKSPVSLFPYLFKNFLYSRLIAAVLAGTSFQKIFQNILCCLFCKRYHTHNRFPLLSSCVINALLSDNITELHDQLSDSLILHFHADLIYDHSG